MNLDITNKNLYLLLPGKVSRVAQIYAPDHHVTIIEAMRRFYHSDTYKRLADETTKLWHYGPVALYQEITDELKQKETKKYGKPDRNNICRQVRPLHRR